MTRSERRASNPRVQGLLCLSLLAISAALVFALSRPRRPLIAAERPRLGAPGTLDLPVAKFWK